MKILAVDDMPVPRRALARAIGAAAPEAELVVCSDAEEVMACADLSTFDVAFIDIDLPGEDGIWLARELAAANSGVNVVFVTGFDEYMGDAFRLHSSGYVMKPVTADKVADELEHLRHPPFETRMKRGLAVRCFGDFEVFADGEPLSFPRAKAKEAFAFLVDRRGAVVSVGTVEAALFADYGKSRRNYVRSLLNDVRVALERAGYDEVLVRSRGSFGVRLGSFECDYYEYLENGRAAPGMRGGGYMRQYSWAESSLGLSSP